MEKETKKEDSSIIEKAAKLWWNTLPPNKKFELYQYHKIGNRALKFTDKQIADIYIAEHPIKPVEQFEGEIKERRMVDIEDAPYILYKELKKENERLTNSVKVLREALELLTKRINNNWDSISSGRQYGIKTALLSEAKQALEQTK